MRFRTEIEAIKSDFGLTQADHILLLGSCFSDNIGSRLIRDGFDVTINTFGPLYNPATLAGLVARLLSHKRYTRNDLYFADDGLWHCLDFAMRYQADDRDKLLETINSQLDDLQSFFGRMTALCVTFGSSEAFRAKFDGRIVGNCHKLSDSIFERISMSVSDIVDLWRPLLTQLRDRGVKVIATVSPIRHLAYGLHGNELGKARLLLALDELSADLLYFPAYEIMLDDLRDYRFYAADMKHPSDVACDYIYEKFADTFFSKSTLKIAEECRAVAARKMHRPLFSDK